MPAQRSLARRLAYLIILGVNSLHQMTEGGRMFGSIPVVNWWQATKRLAAASVLLMLGLAGCSSSSQPAQSQNPGVGSARPAQNHTAGGDVLELVFPYGSEKQKWIDAVTQEFNSGDHVSTSKKRIQVRAIPLGSGELIAEIQEGRLKAHLASPASSVFHRTGQRRIEGSQRQAIGRGNPQPGRLARRDRHLETDGRGVGMGQATAGLGRYPADRPG